MYLNIKLIKNLSIVLLNRYTRKYFISNNKKFRLTLDSAVSYYKTKKINNNFLTNKKIPVVVFSSEKNQVVEKRCEKLGIESYQNIGNKDDALIDWAQTNKVNLNNTIFVGNDINDLECLKTVGCPVAVKDAAEEIKSFAKIILTKNGGEGAVRELIGLILKKIEG